MLRRTIAALLLAMIGCGFYFWSQAKTNTVNDLNALIDKLTAEVDRDDFNSALTTAAEIKRVYEDKHELFNYVHDHEFMNTISDYVAEIEVAINNQDMSRLETAIAYLKNHINDFYNDSQIKLINII